MQKSREEDVPMKKFAALVLALLLDWFDVIATVVPLLAFRPILLVSQLMGKKKGEG